MIHNLHYTDDSETQLHTHLSNEEATLSFGTILSKALSPHLVLWLEGNLGSGKTTLTRGILRGLGYNGKVKSPTYTLIEPYAISRLNLYHFDFYRFTSPEEFLDAGLDEYFSGTGICIVEWPDKAQPYLPLPDIIITLSPDSGGRQIQITAESFAGRQCLRNIIHSSDPSNTPPSRG